MLNTARRFAAQRNWSKCGYTAAEMLKAGRRAPSSAPGDGIAKAFAAARANQYLKQFKKFFLELVPNGQAMDAFLEQLQAHGRNSLGTMPKRCVQNWLEVRSLEQLAVEATQMKANSFARLLQLAHPRPSSPAVEEFYRQALKAGGDADLWGLAWLIRHTLDQEDDMRRVCRDAVDAYVEDLG